MRVLILIALIGAAFASPKFSTRMEQHKRILETEILAVSECIREHLNAGDPEFDIPSFNPLQQDELDLDLDKLGITQYLSGQLDLTNVNLAGITTWDFVSLEGSVSLIPVGYVVKFDVTFDPITANTHYQSDSLTLIGEEHSGDGDLEASVTGFGVSGSLTIGLNGDGITLADVKVTVAVDDIDFSITGVDGDDALSQEISDYISDTLVDHIHNDPDSVSATIEQVIKDVFEGIENGDVGQDIIGIVTQNCINF